MGPIAEDLAEASGLGAIVNSDGGFYSQIRGMVAALWMSRQRNVLFLLVGGLISVVGVTAYAQVRLNAWNGPFYDALAHKKVPQFMQQLIVFAVLAGVLLASMSRKRGSTRNRNWSCAKVWSSTCSAAGCRRFAPSACRTPARSAPIPISEFKRTPASHGTDDRPRHRPPAVDVAAL